MPKAAEAFRTISEVAGDLEIPKHVLRFWEVKFSQIRPMKRGGGRRYYRPEDMELLRGIRHLLHREGYTIKGVQKILKEQGVDAVKIHGKDEGPNVAAPAVSLLPPSGPVSRGRTTTTTPVSVPSVSGTGRREVIRKAITELEAVRAQLGGRPRETMPARAAPRRLASSS